MLTPLIKSNITETNRLIKAAVEAKGEEAWSMVKKTNWEWYKILRKEVNNILDRERKRKVGNKGKRKLKELEVKYRIKKLNIFLIDCNTGVKTDNDCKNCKN